MNQTMQPLASQRVIINSAMSFAGSTQRMVRLRDHAPNQWMKLGITVLFVAPLLLVWWTLIVGWYLVFSVFLIPYRLLRRGARKRKAEALRHAEMMQAVERSSRG